MPLVVGFVVGGLCVGEDAPLLGGVGEGVTSIRSGERRTPEASSVSIFWRRKY